MSIVHLLPTYTHDYLQQLSLKLSVAKPESSHASSEELDCCWKIRNPNHQPKIMKWKPGLLFLMQVHRNKPKGLFYESCNNVTATNIWNWQYNKVTTAEPFRSQSCCNTNLSNSQPLALKPWRPWSQTGIISAMSSQIVLSSSNLSLWHCAIASLNQHKSYCSARIQNVRRCKLMALYLADQAP